MAIRHEVDRASADFGLTMLLERTHGKKFTIATGAQARNMVEMVVASVQSMPDRKVIRRKIVVDHLQGVSNSHGSYPEGSSSFFLVNLLLSITRRLSPDLSLHQLADDILENGSGWSNRDRCFDRGHRSMVCWRVGGARLQLLASLLLCTSDSAFLSVSSFPPRAHGSTSRSVSKGYVGESHARARRWFHRSLP